MNLLENAIRYTQSRAELRISAGALDRRIWIEVADDGPGLPAGSEQRVFEKFYRGPSQPARTGTGLGLAICRGIVELHGGTITARNQPSGGAAFRIELPQPPPPTVPPALEAPAAASASETATILP